MSRDSFVRVYSDILQWEKVDGREDVLRGRIIVHGCPVRLEALRVETVAGGWGRSCTGQQTKLEHAMSICGEWPLRTCRIGGYGKGLEDDEAWGDYVVVATSVAA